MVGGWVGKLQHLSSIHKIREVKSSSSLFLTSYTFITFDIKLAQFENYAKTMNWLSKHWDILYAKPQHLRFFFLWLLIIPPPPLPPKDVHSSSPPFTTLKNGIRFCRRILYSSAPWHRHTYLHCVRTTVETTLFETCFICGRFWCGAGKEEKLPCESRNAKYSPQWHTVAITPASGARPRQWDDSLWCWGGEQFNSHLSSVCCGPTVDLSTQTLLLRPLQCCVQNECNSIWCSD